MREELKTGKVFIIDLSADAKSVRLDIYVEDDGNSVYNIEMQTTENGNLAKRTRYYQGMIDLGILEKGENYKNLKCSFIIFVCTFDLFGKGRHIYTFENCCIQDCAIRLGDDAVKIILNTKGIMNDITPEMKRVLDFIDGKEASDDYTRELEKEMKSIRGNEKWRLDYMTLQMSYQEKFEQGVEQGIGQEKIEAAIRMIEAGKLSVDEIAIYSGLSLEQVLELQKELQPVQGLL